MTLPIQGSKALPVVVVTDEVTLGAPAIPVYGYNGTPTDGRGILAGAATRVKVLTSADLAINGGNYVLEGSPVAFPVYSVEDGYPVQGNVAVAVYPINGWPSCVPISPTLVSAEIGNVDASTVVVVFSEIVEAPDFATGVTIRNNGVIQTIDSATLQPNQTTVYYVLDTPAADTDTLTWSYSGSTIKEAVCGVALLEDVDTASVTNNIQSFSPLDLNPDGYYEGIGAASYAASKVNLAHPGTNNLTSTPSDPAWNTNSGWAMDGSKYLDTGIVPANSNMTIMMRFSSLDLNADGSFMMGEFDGAASGIFAYRGGGNFVYGNGSNDTNGSAPAVTFGTVCVAGNKAYLNGVEDATGLNLDTVTFTSIFWGTINGLGSGMFGNIGAGFVKRAVLTPAEILQLHTYLMSL